MQMEIYADIVFLINLIMDFLILWITAKLCRRKIPRLRILLGAFVSALVYCLMMFAAWLYPLLNVASAVLILAAGIFITFRPGSIREMLKYLIVAHVCAFAVGGAGIALFYMTNIKSAIGSMINFTVENFSFKVLLSSVCFSYIFIKLFSRVINKKTISKQRFYPLEIYYDNNFASLTALVDTGNSLYEPISNEPVVIAEFESIKDILPDKVRFMFFEGKDEDLENILICVQGTTFARKIRLIPFSSLGRKNGMLIGFKPDKIELLMENNDVTISNVVVGICNSKLTSEGNYQALLNPELVS